MNTQEDSEDNAASSKQDVQRVEEIDDTGHTSQGTTSTGVSGETPLVLSLISLPKIISCLQLPRYLKRRAYRL
jgi:hypothetical protein